ncbi:hypothetical protein Tco_0418495 [Tanacetum coccineum]
MRNLCGGAQEADVCNFEGQREQVCLSGGDIFGNPSLLRYYQNDDYPPWGNTRKRIYGEGGLEWVVRNQFEDKLANFMFEKNLHVKGLGEMINEQCNKMRNQFSQIFTTLGDGKEMP